jgi:hypothetical protein
MKIITVLRAGHPELAKLGSFLARLPRGFSEADSWVADSEETTEAYGSLSKPTPMTAGRRCHVLLHWPFHRLLTI